MSDPRLYRRPFGQSFEPQGFVRAPAPSQPAVWRDSAPPLHQDLMRAPRGSAPSLQQPTPGGFGNYSSQQQQQQPLALYGGSPSSVVYQEDDGSWEAKSDNDDSVYGSDGDDDELLSDVQGLDSDGDRSEDDDGDTPERRFYPNPAAGAARPLWADDRAAPARPWW